MAVKDECEELVTEKQTRRLLGLTRQQVIVVTALGLILLLGAFLRFYDLGAYSIGNTYYAATVKSMLSSWHNFFFVAFEPGGSVTVDKPPLGLWVQAVSAYFLGVNGFALALPQALAGVLSILLLYAIVRRQFGAWAGLAAALVLAVLPVAVSTERNNTMDGLLVFVLLLAVWAFLRAVESGRFGYLLLGAILVGLGFNIKMLQAYMPLPALYALYLFGVRHVWWKRILHLSLATAVLLVVSLSWAVAVDLTPAENRPFVGSSEDNTVMELIVGHNGLSRLISMRQAAPSGGGGAPSPPPSSGGVGQVPARPPLPTSPAQPGHSPQNLPPRRPGVGAPRGNPVPPAGPNQPAAQKGDGVNQQEIGSAGALRLFTEPLVTEASWLLPLALLGLPLAVLVLGWRWPLSEQHLALVLWAGWLLPELLYFGFTTGLFHAYYLIMLGPPLAALVGAAAWALGQMWQRRRWLGWTLLTLLTGSVIAFQVVTLQFYPHYVLGVAVIAVGGWLVGVGLLIWCPRGWPSKLALGLLCVSLLVAPLTWSALSTLNTNPNVALPRAGPDDAVKAGGQHASESLLSPAEEVLLDYLLDHADPDGYLVATLNARQAAPYILETGRPVLTFGGFKGSDDVVDVEQLAQMVADGELRFILGWGLGRQKPELAAWVKNNCAVVRVPGVEAELSDWALGPGSGAGQENLLYDCQIRPVR